MHPSPNLIPTANHDLPTLAPLTTSVGPLCRDVRDAAVALGAMAGPDGRDYMASTVATPNLLDELDTGVDGWRFAWTGPPADRRIGMSARQPDFAHRYGQWALVTGAAQGIGAAYAERLHAVPVERKITQIALNCTSVVILADRLTRQMVQRRRGGVIIMASGSPDAGSSYIPTYPATKAFDRVFAEGLWAEMRPYGVDVTTVMPGATQTPGFIAALPPGFEPTRMMRPGDPFAVVDAALDGLGSKINVRPGSAVAQIVGAG